MILAQDSRRTLSILSSTELLALGLRPLRKNAGPQQSRQISMTNLLKAQSLLCSHRFKNVHPTPTSPSGHRRVGSHARLLLGLERPLR